MTTCITSRVLSSKPNQNDMPISMISILEVLTHSNDLELRVGTWSKYEKIIIEPPTLEGLNEL